MYRLLTCAVVMLLVALAAPAQAATVDYVALGDSYAAGTGAGRYEPNARGCLRSKVAGPALWAASHATATFSFPACAGATARSVMATQLSGLSADTDLVTITVGATEAGFVNVMTTCTLRGDAACTRAVSAAEVFVVQQLPAQLDQAYAEIRRRAPAAKVIVVGYPRLFELGPCRGGLSLTKRSVLNRGADTLAEVTAQRAIAAGFLFADSRPRFAGHGLCSPDPWINGVILSNLRESYHPNAKGQANGYLSTVVSMTG